MTRFIFNGLLFVLLCLNSSLKAQDSTFLDRSVFLIKSNSDDSEEREDGSMYFGSSDLELVDDANNQVVGLRFINVDLPRGTKITNAYIQFTVDEVTTGACNLNIYGELSANANPFEDVIFNISSRTRTNNTVQWSPLPWATINESGVVQQSPDLSSIIQEIIDRAEWIAGNSLVLIFSGHGSRTAISHENNPNQAPQLIVEAEFPLVNIPVENVFINEIMAKNSLIEDEYGETNDWIELYNANPFPVYIGGLYLSDDVTDPVKWRLLNPLTLSAEGFAVIWADNDTEQGSLHASFKLSSLGETLFLTQVLNEQIVEIDKVSFDTIPENATYGRKNDGTDNWLLLGLATFNRTNNVSNPYLVAPTISLPGGLYTDIQAVELSSDVPGVDIYYTLDGNIPDKNSLHYTDLIQINETTPLKVRAYKNGYAPSNVVESFYLFHHDTNLPVINISTDPFNLWDDSLGIYTKGTNGAMHHNYPEPANWFQEWERPALITLFEPDGSLAFCKKAGIALGGNDSRKFIQKSFNLHFRKKYGSSAVEYQVFQNSDITKFKHLKLRNSGQDFGSMMMRDGVNQSLLYGVVDMDLLAYRPIVVYLNGEYWGMYGLRDSFTDDYINYKFDVEKSDIDLINGDGSLDWLVVENGSGTDFQDLYHFIENNDLSLVNNYDSVANKIDINEYLNYQIAQIYIANYDWPGNNVKIWRDKINGKWRWMMYDTDASTNFDLWGETHSDFNTLSFVTSATSTNWPNNKRSTLFLRKLLQNNEFKYEFVQRTCTYMALIFNSDRVNSITDRLIDQVDGEMNRQIAKWSQDYPDFGWGTTCGGSKENWLSVVEDYKDFFRDRPGYMMGHMQSYFNNFDTYTLNFMYDEGTNGTVYVNSNDFEIPFNYSAEYFGNYPLKIKAVADPGYVFVQWKETGNPFPETDFIGNSSTTLTAVFAEEGTTWSYLHVYPNPVTSDNIHVNFKGYNHGEKIDLRIFNILGEEIENYFLYGTNEAQNIDMPIQGWSSGIYILKLYGESLQQTAKLIVN